MPSDWCPTTCKGNAMRVWSASKVQDALALKTAKPSLQLVYGGAGELQPLLFRVAFGMAWVHGVPTVPRGMRDAVESIDYRNPHTDGPMPSAVVSSTMTHAGAQMRLAPPPQ